MIDSVPDLFATTDRAGPCARRQRASDRAAPPFIDQVREFRAFGRPSVELQEGAIRYFVNEFWTSGQRQAHSIHEVSYRACFKPQLPEFFIERLTQPGDAVYDPFMGRGTTPLQAALMGRRPVGNDVNPLSVLLTRPRLERADAGRDRANGSTRSPGTPGKIEDAELLAFYSPRTLARTLRAARLAHRKSAAGRRSSPRSTTGSGWWRSTG